MSTLINLLFFPLFLAACCLPLYLTLRNTARNGVFAIVSGILGIVGFLASDGWCWSDESLPYFFTLFKMRFRSFGFRMVEDTVVVVGNNCGWTISFRLERDVVLVVINVVIEGWRSLSSDLSMVLWTSLKILVVVKVKYFVNLYYFSSLCRRFNEWTMRFAIAIHLLIACIFICPTSSSPMLNHFD